jgi:hypothetical protein
VNTALNLTRAEADDPSPLDRRRSHEPPAAAGY